MSWNGPDERVKYYRLKQRFLAATRDEQDAVTWNEAEEYVLPDTMKMALWNGLKSLAIAERKLPADALRGYFGV